MKKTELLNEQNNNEMSINTKDIVFHEIEDSPFTAVKRKNKAWIIVMGDALATRKKFKTKEDAENYVKGKPWELIFVGSNIFNEKMQERTKNEDL